MFSDLHDAHRNGRYLSLELISIFKMPFDNYGQVTIINSYFYLKFACHDAPDFHVSLHNKKY